MTDEVPLYILGMPKEEFGAELIRQKLENVLERLSKVYSKIDEARVTIEIQSVDGKRHSYDVSILIKTARKIHWYNESGWELSTVCEKLGQKLLNTLTKHDDKRIKLSIRKNVSNLIEE